jgi:hypothetical protein
MAPPQGKRKVPARQSLWRFGGVRKDGGAIAFCSPRNFPSKRSAALASADLSAKTLIAFPAPAARVLPENLHESPLQPKYSHKPLFFERFSKLCKYVHMY